MTLLDFNDYYLRQYCQEEDLMPSLLGTSHLVISHPQVAGLSCFFSTIVGAWLENGMDCKESWCSSVSLNISPFLLSYHPVGNVVNRKRVRQQEDRDHMGERKREERAKKLSRNIRIRYT